MTCNNDEVLSLSDRLSDALMEYTSDAINKWFENHGEQLETLPDGTLEVIISNSFVKMGVLVHIDKFASKDIWVLLDIISNALREYDPKCDKCEGIIKECPS